METMDALINKNPSELSNLLREVVEIEKKFPEYKIECTACKEFIKIVEKKIDDMSKYVI